MLGYRDVLSKIKATKTTSELKFFGGTPEIVLVTLRTDHYRKLDRIFPVVNNLVSSTSLVFIVPDLSLRRIHDKSFGTVVKGFQELLFTKLKSKTISIYLLLV